MRAWGYLVYLMEQAASHPSIQTVKDPLVDSAGVMLGVLRLDLVHPEVSGNKWYKLKYNLRQARAEGYDTLLTFGGAYSNHIYATAAAGRASGFRTIGVIRGERSGLLNPTLHFAEKQGMQLHFVSRDNYREKEKPSFVHDLQQQYGQFYLLPEGGTNLLAVKGCAEILPARLDFDVICCSVGTGGTLAGILVGLAGKKQVLGFPALKGGSFLQSDIDSLTQTYQCRSYTNYRLITDYHFGGYARANRELVNFINEFFQNQGVLLDPIYNGKMFYGLFDLMRQGYFGRGSRLLVIHTGGLQGIAGFNERYKTKKMRILEG